MPIDLKKEIPLLLVVLLPFAYLYIIQSELPEQVEAFWAPRLDYASKTELWLIPIAVTLIPYLILSGYSSKNAKKELEVKFIPMILMSVVTLYLLYGIRVGSLLHFEFFFFVIGAFLLAVSYIIFANKMRSRLFSNLGFIGCFLFGYLILLWQLV